MQEHHTVNLEVLRDYTRKPQKMANILNHDWGIAISPPIVGCGVDACLPILVVHPLYPASVQTRKIKFSSLWFSTTTFNTVNLGGTVMQNDVPDNNKKKTFFQVLSKNKALNKIKVK